MTLMIEVEQEADGRWLAEVPSLPGVVTYGQTRTDAYARVQALALRVLADRLEHGEAVPELLNVTFQAAKARARGYRTTKNLLNMAYLLAADLDFALPT